MYRTFAVVLLGAGIMYGCGGSDGPTDPPSPSTFLTLNTVVINSNGGTAVINDFQAKIDGRNVPWGVAQSVGAGTRMASELLVPGYAASSWLGDCAPDGSVTLALGDSKSCLITNEDSPTSLILVNVIINDDGGTATITDFQAKIDGGIVPWGVAQAVGVGSFTVSATIPTGYTAGTWTGDCASDGSVTLTLGENKACVITTDDDPAFLTLNNIVVNDNGGTAVPNDFQAKINGSNVTWGLAQSVGAGSFTVTQTGVAGYTGSSWTGDCAADGSITIANGESKTCTITNNDDAPSFLTLNAVVVNNDGGTAVINDFQALIDGGSVPWGVAQSVGAGSFIANEDLIPFYVAGTWGGDCAADGRVTLANGQNKTCSITYDDNVCVPIAGMAHWWPGEGTGADVIGGLDAAVIDGAGYAPGLPTAGGGQAFQFDGVDAIARVEDNDDLNPTVAFSVQAWARPGADPTFNGAIIGKGHPLADTYVIDHESGVWRGFSGRNVINGPAIQSGVWTHLVLAWDGQTLIFYVDGLEAGRRGVTSLGTTDAFLGIGNRSELGVPDENIELEFAGEIDEVAMFSRALTASEVQAIHAAGTLGSCRP